MQTSNQDFYPKITKTDLEYERESQSKTFFKSRFKFLQEHNGIRPACVHLLIATAGAGKSTLTRSILSDMMLTKKKFLLILSEESRAPYIANLRSIIPPEYDTSGMVIYSEIDSLDRRYEIDREVERLVTSGEVEVVFYDNITTSEWYGDSGDNKKQAESFKRLKRVSIKTGVPVFAIAHVSGKIGEGHKELIDQNFIEGSKAPIKMAEFIYVLQTLAVKEKLYTTLRITKHRTNNVKSRLFLLEYDDAFKCYTGDKELDFVKFKEIFKARNTLTGR